MLTTKFVSDSATTRTEMQVQLEEKEQMENVH